MTGDILPKKLVFAIGSYACRRETLQWDGEKLIYQASEHGDSSEQKIIVPGGSEWQNFWIAVRNIGVWHWRGKYDEIYVCDGVEWEIELAVGDEKIKSEGCGSYPPNGADVASEAFKQLLRALGELMNDQVFIKGWYYEAWD
ncbi:MAG: hypothetical protein OEZ58_18300 [Gammaproteobacteria bacterium]|nr:hypothetical protein [Gammaproteobacteria bacterium]